MWKYSQQHLNISDADAANFATYAFGETCGREHVEPCENSTILATFFYMSFASFLNDTVLKQINNDPFKPKINTTINDVLLLNLMIHH